MTISSPFGLSLPLRIESGGWATSSGDDKVKENLVHILLTAVGERPMRRAFGGGVEALVHDPEDAVLYGLLRHQVAQAIGRWEPRVQLRDVQVGTGPDEHQGRSTLVVIEYVMRATRERGRIAVPLSLAGVP